MSYFVTGATGFIGRFLVANLLKRKGTIHVLVRKDSQKKFDAIAKKMDWDMKRITVLHGDMAAARCGLTAAQVRALKGKVKHFFHLAAIYDLDAGAEAQRVANVDGDRKRGGEGKSVSVSLDLGGRRIIKKQKTTRILQ